MFYKIRIGFLILILSVLSREAMCSSKNDYWDDLTNIQEQQKLLNDELQHGKKAPQLFIFVSFSMPKESLKAWAEQAKRVDGTLLLRGLYENSIRQTSSRTIEIFGEKGAGDLKVDPESYRLFNIQRVPSVVLSVPSKEGYQEPCDPPVYDCLSGDISVEAALEKFMQQGSVSIKPIAKQLLEQYRASQT